MTTLAPSPAQPFLDEIRREAATTRRMLEALPEDMLAWRPHPRSHTLGQLARHVATLPSGLAGMLSADTFDFAANDMRAAQPASKAEILAALDQGVRDAEAAFSTWDASDLGRTWRALKNGVELLALPKAAVLRSLLCNHLVHHRGQLSVYLRLLDVPLPSVYGPTADENPFG
jgi:uncharacterized damage-inducible protein DinB